MAHVYRIYRYFKWDWNEPVDKSTSTRVERETGVFFNILKSIQAAVYCCTRRSGGVINHNNGASYHMHNDMVNIPKYTGKVGNENSKR